jgi:glycosyl transferase family 2
VTRDSGRLGAGRNSAADGEYWREALTVLLVASPPNNHRMAPETIVAIPARDEAGSIGPCLSALAHPVGLDGKRLDGAAFGVVLLLNNCRDATAEIARDFSRRLPYQVRILLIELPDQQAHAGGARRFAMDAAADWVLEAKRADGYLLTTDADTRVAPDWIVRQHVAFAKGADVVAGMVYDDPTEFRRLPTKLRWRGRLEARYTWLLTEIEARLDPDPDDPWPRHAMAPGASLGVRLSWYRRVGGVPMLACGEDRTLVSRLSAAGARVRHCLQTRVITSCRLEGRAAGGAADTMRQRIAERESFCDAGLEPALDAMRRYFWRGLLRRWHREAWLANNHEWAPSLGLSAENAVDVAHLADFAALWEAVTSQSPQLVSRLLRPAELPEEISRAKRIVRILRRGGLAPVPKDQVPHGVEYHLELMRRHLALPGHRADRIGFENAA